MNVLVAPDSFKGSLTAVRAAGIIAESIVRCDPAARCVLLPQADGGEGTLAVLESQRGGTRHTVAACDPLGRRLEADWLLLPDGTAVIESADVIGFTLLDDAERNPAQLRSTGLGSMLRAVTRHGAQQVLIALGGSATNDAGLGFAEAMGYAFHYDTDPGRDVFRALRTLRGIDASRAGGTPPVTVLADVRNPLCGPRGATAVYGPQKGVQAGQLERVDHAVAHFATIVRRDVRFVDSAAAGMGAAGGLGFALSAFCGARLRPGADVVRAMTGFTEALAGCDLVITGEGRLDAQSREGKVVAGIAAEARSRGVPVVAFAGEIAGSSAWLAEALGLRAAIRVTPEDVSTDDGMRRADALLSAAVSAFWQDFPGTR
ncbi:MAG: glycerate kinase [Bacteroidota bacterium]|nr:glycerate kinase [Bacteroidota bacterium]